MSKLCFHWDEAEAFKKDDLARKKLMKQWTHTAKAFGVYHLLVIGKKENIPVIGDIEIKIEHFSIYKDVRKAYPDEKYVVITEEGKEKVNFPKECIFVMGSNYVNPEITKGDIAVSIKANIPLWDVIAASIILHKAQ